MPHISPIDPIGPAWNRMVLILFKPFQFKKWLLLGFCAFLAQCGEGGSSQVQIPDLGSGPGSRGGFVDGDWFAQNMTTVVLVAIAALLLVVGCVLLITWLNSRGKFMLIDGVVKNRGAVSEPWREYRPEGNSLFLFRICFGLLAFAAGALIVLLGLAIASPDISDEKFELSATAGLVIGGSLMLLWLLLVSAISFFLRVFVVPTMYLKRVRVMEGWRVAWGELGRNHVGSILLFFLMLLVLGMAAGVVGMFIFCLTCCLAMIPYVSSVIFLPIIIFFEAYVLEYIQQHGEGWSFFPRLCKGCGYDLQGHDASGACPECGRSIVECRWCGYDLQGHDGSGECPECGRSQAPDPGGGPMDLNDLAGDAG